MMAKLDKEQIAWDLRGNVVVFINDKLALREWVHRLFMKVNSPVLHSDLCGQHAWYGVSYVGISAVIIMNHDEKLDNYGIHVSLLPAEIDNMERNTVELLMSLEGIESAYDAERDKFNHAVKLAIYKPNTMNIYVFGKGQFINIYTPRDKWERRNFSFKIQAYDSLDALEHDSDLRLRIMQILESPKGFRDTQLLQQVSP
jgi:hypothetical protein